MKITVIHTFGKPYKGMFSRSYMHQRIKYNEIKIIEHRCYDLPAYIKYSSGNIHFWEDGINYRNETV